MTKLSRRDFIVKTPVAIAATAATLDNLRAATIVGETHSESDTSKNAGSPALSEHAETLPFTHEDLFNSKVRDTYQGDYLDAVAFPLGGIGSGCISLGGTGRLMDWEIFNNPNRGFQPRFTFLSVWAEQEGSKPAFRVLEGLWRGSPEGAMYVNPTLEAVALGNGEGPQFTHAAGLPRMRQCKFTGRFPFAHVDLSDKSLPVAAKVEGWSPFIPGNSRDSSLPIAVLNVTLTNTTRKPVKAAVAINVQNCAGDRNEIIRDQGLSMLYMRGEKDDGNSMFVATPVEITQWQTNWLPGRDFLPLQHFFDTFGKTGKLDNSPEKPASAVKKPDDSAKVGSIAMNVELQPGESRTFPIILGWYFPIFDTATENEVTPGKKSWRNYYATEWKSGMEVARYAVTNLKRLETDTRLFQENFFSSTIPGIVLEAASTQLAILRSPTIIRYPDGTLYGWEGCAIDHRLGYGTVNHVWNYQQTIPYLFPDLQRSLLNNCFFNGLRDSDGAMQYRVPAGPGAKAADMPPNSHNGKANFFAAADGQFGLVTQVYRDWHICGDNAWLQNIWPRVKKAMEYAWKAWDPKREGLLTGSHHCTLDINFSTPETMCGSQYQAALLACEKLALAMGDADLSRECRRIFESGKTLSDEKLFNGQYYQQLAPAPEPGQLETGCISEMVNGQLYARMLDLEDVYNPEHIHKSLGTLFRENYRDGFFDVVNVQRVYSLNDDRGLLIATWPNAGRPADPVAYCDETWPGSEYQAAFNMIYDGYLKEGLTIVKSVRDRHDGKKRNPFCEFEWGNHYTRSMIAFAGLLAVSQFRYSAVDKSLQLMPLINPRDFRIFFSVDSGWGVISQSLTNTAHMLSASVSKGTLTIKRFHIESDQKPHKAVASIGGQRVQGKISAVASATRRSTKRYMIELDEELTAKPGSPVHLNLDLEAVVKPHQG